uniref:Calpain catalytic domain-containing protein n=1 Tax=Periophthalmus magnuspinnatus TaxID=409849 RepID=A0A3B4B828_9GOBI
MSSSAVEPDLDKTVVRKSVSRSSNSSPPPEDDIDSVCQDELLGSQSKKWLADLLSAVSVDLAADPDTVGRDGFFVDHHFPLGELEMQSGVKWKRPRELCASPQFIVNGATRLDICQGKLNDCWLLAAIASLSVNDKLFQKVVPPGQDFQQHYTGRFSFRFWQYGEWVEVRVDDLLPTKDNKLIYLSSPERQEFWSSLLEKAYAKLKGGYRALDMGFPHEAMVDMTGGVAEVLTISHLPRDLYSFIQSLLAKGALINCANCQGPLEQKNPLGIMFRHAYSVTAMEKVFTLHHKWEGPWSDSRSPEWSTVSSQEQQRLGRVNREDGEFWMSVADFRQNFESMEVCHLTKSPSQSASSVRPWCCVMHHGNWVPNISNPQFLLELSQVDPSSDPPVCSFVLSLMQKHQRRRGLNLSTALHLYMVGINSTRPLLCSPQYSSRREVVLRDSLPPGRYIIIPSTAETHQQGDFLLRVLTEQNKSTRSVLSFFIYCRGKEQRMSDVLTQGMAKLNWPEFQALWDKIRRWTVSHSAPHLGLGQKCVQQFS